MSDQVQEFRQEGVVLVRRLFQPEEIRILRAAAAQRPDIEQNALQREDGEGGVTRLHLWNEASDDVFGLVARSRRIVERMQAFLGDEVYYYHSKLNLKEARTGGAWAWHQDYGYWYNNGCLSPDMASCMIAIDPATRENGCLQIVPRSHQVGRIDHGKVGDQTGADPERVAAILERLPVTYCEMEPGDGVFFHSNLLHRSDQNRSEHSRWVYICCYNTRTNDPYKDSKHPRYSPLDVVEDTAILEWAERQATADRGPAG